MKDPESLQPTGRSGNERNGDTVHSRANTAMWLAVSAAGGLCGWRSLRPSDPLDALRRQQNMDSAMLREPTNRKTTSLGLRIRTAVWLGVLLAACSPAPSAVAPTPQALQASPPLLPEPAPLPLGPATAEVPPAIVIESGNVAGPWTHLNPPRRAPSLRFAVIADRTGGLRAPVFASAIPKVNALGPDLVLSVGDFIPGYGAKDLETLGKQWDEVDTLVKQLEAPFFYVPGNHDIHDDVSRQAWNQRYGATYYAFRHAGMLFVCLDTVDPIMGQIRPEEMSWLERVLARHTDVTWTFLFMHVPLWEDWSGLDRKKPRTAAWDKLASLLGKRPFTAFSGHHHRYVKHERKGRALYTLATTGGGSGSRGPEYGEFDHVAWVTVTDDGPRVANLALDGILGDDLRTEQTRVFEERLLADDALKPTPVYFESAFRPATGTLKINNAADAPLTVSLSAEARDPYAVTPVKATLTVAPHTTSEPSFQVVSRVPGVPDGSGIDIDWHAASSGPAGESFELSGSSVLSVVRVLQARRVARPVIVDGRLADWGALPIVVDHPRQFSRDAAAWRGPEDNRFRLGVAYDASRVFIAVEVFDDTVDVSRKRDPWAQDGIEIRVDARPDPARAHSAGARDGKAYLLIAMSPSESPEDDWLYSPEWLKLPEGTEVACVRNGKGFVTEVAIPRSWIAKASGESDGLLRVNVAVSDRDKDGRSTSWWWPDWRTADDLPGSGTIRVGR